MDTKTINRNIPENRENTNDRFRVRYKDKNSFKQLIVNIVRLKTGESKRFKFSSDELPDKDSIYFTTRVLDGKFTVEWKSLLML